MPADTDMEGENSDSSSVHSSSSDGILRIGLNHSVSWYENLAYPSQAELKTLVQTTELHVELADDLLQATFELMKQVVLPEPCSSGFQRCVRRPTVSDFQRAYSLVRDWFPEHPSEPSRSSLWMWYYSKAEMLQALLGLAEMEVLPGQDSCKGFTKWVREQIERKDPHEEEILNSVIGARAEVISRVATGEGSTPREITTAHSSQTCSSREGELRDRAHHNVLAMHALLCESSTRIHYHCWQRVFKLLRVVYAVLMVNTFAMFEAGAIGFIMQFFLDLNILHVGNFVFKECRMVVSAPFLLVIGALAGSEIFELACDSMRDPPFAACRAHMMVTLEMLCRGRADGLSPWTVRVLDFLFTWALIGPLVIGALSFAGLEDIFMFIGDRGDSQYLQTVQDSRESLQTIEDRGWLNGQMHGSVIAGLIWCVCIWILFMLCKLYTGLSTYSRMSTTDNLGDGSASAPKSFPVLAVVRVIQDNLACYNVFPGFCWRYAVTINRHMAAHAGDHLSWTIGKVKSWVEEWKPDSWPEYSEKIALVDPTLHNSRMGKSVLFGFAGAILWPILYTVIRLLVGALCKRHLDTHSLHVVSICSCGVLIVVAVGCLAESVCRLLPKLDTSAFRNHILLFQVLNICMMLLSTLHNQFLFEGTPDRVMLANSTSAANYYNSIGTEGMEHTVTPYPLCQIRWGQEVRHSFEDFGRLSALDLGVLSWYSYAANRTLFTSLVEDSFGNGVEVLNVTAFDTIPRTVVVRFPAARKRKGREGNAGTIVVAVKGTSTMEEAFADMGMYTDMAMLQLMDKVLPILHTFPVSVIAMAIGYLTVPFSGKVVQRFLEELRQSVSDLRKAYPNHSVVLTGHSLGGGLAEVAAAQLGVPALVFSAPGNLFVTRQLQVPKRGVYRNIVGVVPDDDVVPRVDEHADMVQHIPCLDRAGVPRDSFTCHSVLVSICEIWRVCGDVQRRDFVPTCVQQKGYVNQTCKSEGDCY